MAFGVLSDDGPLYAKGRALYSTTVAEYFEWGRPGFAAGRVLGESTETLRDVYHTLCAQGLGFRVWQRVLCLRRRAFVCAAPALRRVPAAGHLRARDLRRSTRRAPPQSAWAASSRRRRRLGCRTTTPTQRRAT